VTTILSQSRAIAEVLIRDELTPAPRTSLNRPIGMSRRLAAVEAPLEDVKEVKRVLGGTVNDVVLAVTAGGLRRLFEQREEDVDHVRAMAPLGLRRAGEALTLGGEVSSLFVDLAIAEPDPLLRYRKISAAAEESKSNGPAASAGGGIEMSDLAPSLIQSVIARLAFTPRLFNVSITNIPGPQFTLYALGAPMRHAIPLTPISTGYALGVAVASYDGKMTFSLNADRDSVPDLDLVRAGIEETLHDLARVAA
jgi:diacylglycerol O-acyltransferase / wax synthase